MSKFLLIIFIIIRIISNPVANVFQKKLSDDNSPFVINFYTYLFLSLICCFQLSILNQYIYTNEFIILVLVCGILCTLGMICMIKAVSLGELSVLGPINSYKSIISLVIAFFLLKEIPTITGLAGIILIVAGSRYIFTEESSNFSLNLLKRKDIQLRFLALTLTAIEAVLLKRIILISSVEICFMFWCFTGFFWSLILLFIFRKTPIMKKKAEYIPVLLIALCLGLMQYSTNYVFDKMYVGFALAVFQLSSVVTVFLGYKFFHETNIIKKLIGSIIMITGSCLIILC